MVRGQYNQGSTLSLEYELSCLTFVGGILFVGIIKFVFLIYFFVETVYILFNNFPN